MTFNEIFIKELPKRFAGAKVKVGREEAYQGRVVMRIKLTDNVELAMSTDDVPRECGIASWIAYHLGSNDIIPHLGSEVHFPDDNMSIRLTEDHEVFVRDYFDVPVHEETS